MPILTCKCGNTHAVTQTELERGRKYCSAVCSRKFRVYAVKAETLDAKVTVTMTKGLRKTLEQRASMEGIQITDLARQYLVAGLESTV